MSIQDKIETKALPDRTENKAVKGDKDAVGEAVAEKPSDTIEVVIANSLPGSRLGLDQDVVQTGETVTLPIELGVSLVAQGGARLA